MPLTYALRRHTLCIITKGDVEYKSGLETLKQALGEARRTGPPAAGALWDLIFDVRESTENRSADELRGIAMALAQHSDLLSGRMAVVVPGPFMQGQGRVFSVFAEQLGQEPKVFGELTEAEAWLSTG